MKTHNITHFAKGWKGFGAAGGTSQLGHGGEKEGLSVTKGGMELKNAALPARSPSGALVAVGLRKQGGKMVGQCPACAEQGGDKQRNHLIIQPDGRFGCVVHPGAQGKEHRKRIFQLIGDKNANHKQNLPATPLDISLL